MVESSKDKAGDGCELLSDAPDKVPVTLPQDWRLKVLKEGWLLKKSKKLKTWIKRYFVLDNAALYFCKTPEAIPDGVFIIRKCQFHFNEKTSSFDIITSGQVNSFKCPDGITQLQAWVDCYKGAMMERDFPYFHVEQTDNIEMSREFLLGVMTTGLRLVKLGLYDPGREEEMAFYRFPDLSSFGAKDLETFEFSVAAQGTRYRCHTHHAKDIEAMATANLARWQAWQQQERKAIAASASAASSSDQRDPAKSSSPLPPPQAAHDLSAASPARGEEPAETTAAPPGFANQLRARLSGSVRGTDSRPAPYAV